MKVVYKPWGKEEWLEQNEFYLDNKRFRLIERLLY